MSQQPDEPQVDAEQPEDDSEGHMIGAAIAMSGILTSRPRQPQFAKEDALPLDEQAGRSHKSSDRDGKKSVR